MHGELKSFIGNELNRMENLLAEFKIYRGNFVAAAMLSLNGARRWTPPELGCWKLDMDVSK